MCMCVSVSACADYCCLSLQTFSAHIVCWNFDLISLVYGFHLSLGVPQYGAHCCLNIISTIWQIPNKCVVGLRPLSQIGDTSIYSAISFTANINAIFLIGFGSTTFENFSPITTSKTFAYTHTTSMATVGLDYAPFKFACLN